MRYLIKPVLFLVFIAFISSCRKFGEQPGHGHPPPLFSVNPQSSIVYGAVTIMGKAFDTVKKHNMVLFNGDTAIINSASATQLVVTVPKGATSGDITLTYNSKTVTIAKHYKVLQPVLVKTVPYPPNTKVAALVFDKSGSSYAVINYYSQSVSRIVKVVNNKLVTIYQTPGDSVVPIGDGNKWVFQHKLECLVLDPQGNLYSAFTTTRVKERSDNSYLQQDLATSIYKISPSGHATVLADSVNTAYLSFIANMAISPQNDIYFIVYDSGNESHNEIQKVTQAGVASIFFHSPQYSYVLNSLAVDNAGNVYTYYGNHIQKFNPQGQVTGVWGNFPYGYFQNMFFDPAGNLYATSGFVEGTFHGIINTAGYLSVYPFDAGLDGSYMDPAGNLYSVGNYASGKPVINEYSFR